MEYMETKEAAEKWGYTQATISKWCREGKITLVMKSEKKGGRWQIPVNAECPKWQRTTKGQSKREQTISDSFPFIQKSFKIRRFS